MRVYVAPRPVDWSQIFRGLEGRRGLIAAIVGQAYYDLCLGDLDAAGYFLSPYYQHHLESLDMPGHWLPAGVRIEDEGDDLEVAIVEEQVIDI